MRNRTEPFSYNRRQGGPAALVALARFAGSSLRYSGSAMMSFGLLSLPIEQIIESGLSITIAKGHT
jgi:hypothetical protein